MGWFKKIFGNSSEETARTTSSDSKASANHRATKGGTPNNAAHTKAAAISPSSPDAAKQNAGLDKPVPQNKTIVSDKPLFSGLKAARQGDDSWDKGRKSEAVKHYEQAIAEGYNNGDRPYVHLGLYYMERKDWKNLKRITDISPESVKDHRWFFEAQQLIEKNLGKIPNGWIDIEGGKTANGETWSEKYERLTSAFPQFDFDEGDSESEIREEDVKALRDFELDLEYRRQQAQACIEKKDYRQAAEICAEFIRNDYWKPWPYDMLMNIYETAGLTDERRRLAVHAEKFFNNRREDMHRYTLRLAAQVGCETYAENLIKEGKRIPYHDGLFDVYSPYPEIEEWRKIIGG